MYYTYAEKQGNALFGNWQMRELAFDTMRRYLYYSAPVTSAQIVPPNVGPPGRRATGSSQSSSFSSPVTPHPPQMPSSSQGDFASPLQEPASTIAPPPPPPHLPSEIVWKKKIKVDKIVLVAKEHEFLLEDVHLTEADLFQVEIHGELRTLQQGESPAPEPLLCPSTGLAGHPSRMRIENDEYTHDPLFLRELYEALRDQFTNLRLERERIEGPSASEEDVGSPSSSAHKPKKMQTLQSPRKKDSHVKSSRVKLSFRLRIDYEFRRFWYVVQTVLGYDKLGTRPYRGLPPYDPRNGIVFAQIPMYCYHVFKALEKAVFYNFVRGDLVGRNTKGELAVVLRGCFLCVTHDTVFVLRDSGTIPRWFRVNQARDFYYSIKGRHPFMAFITDPVATDLIFIPQPPPFGAVAIATYNAAVDVVKVLSVVREMCLQSLEIRRVINVYELRDMPITQFTESVEARLGRRLQFDTIPGREESLSCPLPKEQLANVWREVQEIYATRDPTLVNQAAIPVYSNNTNATDLPAEQVVALTRRLARERTSRDDIVGLPVESAHHLLVDNLHHTNSGVVRRHGSRDEVGAAGLRGLPHSQTAPGRITDHVHGVPSSMTSANRPVLTRLPEDSLVTPQLGASPTGACPVGDSGAPLDLPMSYSLTNDSFTGSFARSFGVSVQYGEPGAQYITAADLAASRPPHPSDYVVEHHVVVTQTPHSAGAHASEQFLQNPERNVSEVMAASLSAMRQQRDHSRSQETRDNPLVDSPSSDSVESPYRIYHSTVET